MYRAEQTVETVVHPPPPAFIFHILTTNSTQLRVSPTRRRGMHFYLQPLVCSQAELFPAPGGTPSTDMWRRRDSRYFNLRSHLSNENTQSSVWPNLPRVTLLPWERVCMCHCVACVVCFTYVCAHLWESWSDTQSVALEAMSLCCRADGCLVNANDALTATLLGVALTDELYLRLCSVLYQTVSDY